MKSPFKEPKYTRDENDIPEGDLNMDDGSLNGAGLPEQPFRPGSISQYSVQRIANIARARGKAVDCVFGESKFVITPDATIVEDESAPLSDGDKFWFEMYLSTPRKKITDLLNS